MLRKFHAVWGGEPVATHNGEDTSYEVLEALITNTHMELPIVEPRVHPQLPEPYNTLEQKVATLGNATREYARAVIYSALGYGKPTFMHGRMIAENPRTIPQSTLEHCGYGGKVGYVFSKAPGWLLWVNFCQALGVRGFSMYAGPTQSLVLVQSAESYSRACAWATETYGSTPAVLLNMVQALLDNDARLLTRIHRVFPDAPPLWSKRSYYKFLPCLVDVICDEMPGVVLGVLCPHVPRPGPCDLPRDANFVHPAYWYMAAADSGRPMEWRKQVVRALALPTLATAPGSTLSVRVADIEAKFPTYTKAKEAVKFVRKYTLRDFGGFPVLVPDNSDLEGDVRALNRAVSTSRLKPRAKHRLPTMKISKKLRCLLNKIKDV